MKQKALINYKRNFDIEYKTGAHWNTELPSKNINLFIKLLKGNEINILDAGCGGGRDIIFLANNYKNIKFFGVDISKIAIKIAKQKIKKLNINNLKLIIGSVEKTNFLNDYFDAIYSGYVCSGKNFPKQITELFRILKPKGFLYLVMFTKTKHNQPSNKDENNPIIIVKKTIIACGFKIVNLKLEKYWETDEEGPHYHEKLTLILVK